MQHWTLWLSFSFPSGHCMSNLQNITYKWTLPGKRRSEKYPQCFGVEQNVMHIVVIKVRANRPEAAKADIFFFKIACASILKLRCKRRWEFYGVSMLKREKKPVFVIRWIEVSLAEPLADLTAARCQWGVGDSSWEGEQSRSNDLKEGQADGIKRAEHTSAGFWCALMSHSSYRKYQSKQVIRNLLTIKKFHYPSCTDWALKEPIPVKANTLYYWGLDFSLWQRLHCVY